MRTASKRLTVGHHKKKDFVKVATAHKQSIQQPLGDAKKSNIILIVVNKKAEAVQMTSKQNKTKQNPQNNKLFTDAKAENFPGKGKNLPSR